MNCVTIKYGGGGFAAVLLGKALDAGSMNSVSLAKTGKLATIAKLLVACILMSNSEGLQLKKFNSLKWGLDTD